MSPVLVTGAGGFIGRRVVAVAREEGLEVIAVARRPLSEGLRTMDLTKPLDGLPPVDTVLHLAGAYAGADSPTLARADLAMARNLIAWGVRAGVRRWVFASAAEVYGRCPAAATEETPPAPLIPYGDAKLTIETWLAEVAARVPGSRVVALRIGEVYGRRGKLIDELTTRMRRGFCPWFGRGRVVVSFVHVDDVARSFLAAMRRAPTGFLVVNVADDQPVPWRAFLNHLAARLGARPPVALPMPVAFAYAMASSAWDTMRRRPPLVTRNIVRLASTPKPMSNARLRETLDLRPRYPDYRSGLKEVLDAPAPR